jgi:GMP synthase (glutamine-hydrolysing)
MSGPVLVVEHEAQCPPGWVGEWLEDAGMRLDVRRPYRGEPLPPDLSGHAALVVLGGSMDAYADEDHPWLVPVKDLLRQAAAGGTPTLAICLGHPLAAVALGGSARRNPRGQQVGVLRVGWTAAAADDPLFAVLTDVRVGVQWNEDVVDRLPAGAVVLAETTHGELQVARLAPTVWGVQLHPEAGAQIIRAWADNDRDSYRERGLDIDAYVAQVAAAHDELRAGWRRLGDRFSELVTEAVLST